MKKRIQQIAFWFFAITFALWALMVLGGIANDAFHPQQSGSGNDDPPIDQCSQVACPTP